MLYTKMKIKKLILIVMIGLGWFGLSTYADNFLNLEQFLNAYLNVITKDQNIPSSYKNIKVKYKNINTWSSLNMFMQKAASVNLFPNVELDLPLERRVTQDQVCAIIKNKFDIDAVCQKWKYANIDWLKDVLLKVQSEQKGGSKEIKFDINNWYIDNGLLNEISKKLNKNSNCVTCVYDDIKDIVEGMWDQYTTFFPPTDAKDFNEELDGEYQGIGAYVDMNKPWELMITAPISWSPAEKAWIKAGDRVVKIGNNIVTDKVDIKTAISWIKWVEGTYVILVILRKGELLTLKVKREKIIIKSINSKLYNDNLCYVNISIFGYGVYKEFVDNMNNFANVKCDKYIFDVRNNPGGSLDEVLSILDYFVPTNKPSVIIESKAGEQSVVANDSRLKLTNEKIIILQNAYSASASEIFAGTIRDYGSYVKLIWEKSFWKWSVQELVEYSDGSMLKYTIAKWYTWWSKTSVDHNGLLPNISIVDDPKTIEDEQLYYALRYNFWN